MNPIQHGLRICFGSLMSREIHRVEDDIGPVIVTQRGDKRVLSFGSPLEQSSVLMSRPWYLNHEYTQVMLLALIFVDARHVTLMGLGGGSLVHCLHHFYPAMHVSVIELRQAVIDVAYRHFGLPRAPGLEVCQADARQYVHGLRAESTDIIYSDLYEATGMVELQAHESYLKACHAALTGQGWLVLNFHSKPKADSSLAECVRTLFPRQYLCNVIKGNWILFCGKSAAGFDYETLRQRAEALVQHVDMPLMTYYRQLRETDWQALETGQSKENANQRE